MSKKYNKLYEGVLTNLAQKILKGAEKGDEKISSVKQKAGEVKQKAVRGVQKAGRSLAKGTVEKTPFGYANRAVKAIKKLKSEFEEIIADAENKHEYMSELSAKLKELYVNIIKRYQDNIKDGDEKIDALRNQIKDFRAKVQKIVPRLKGIVTTAQKTLDTDQNPSDEEPVTESIEKEFKIRMALFEEIDSILEDMKKDGITESQMVKVKLTFRRGRGERQEVATIPATIYKDWQSISDFGDDVPESVMDYFEVMGADDLPVDIQILKDTSIADTWTPEEG
jgi:uncharacterized coiled-coil DUF342 family protein